MTNNRRNDIRSSHGLAASAPLGEASGQSNQQPFPIVLHYDGAQSRFYRASEDGEQGSDYPEIGAFRPLHEISGVIGL